MRCFPCPYLNVDVELTDEREEHIRRRHAELLPHMDLLAQVLDDPDEVRVDPDYHRTRLFIRWFGGLLGGKLIIAALVQDPPPSNRHWIVTAFITNRPAKGEIEWKRT